MVTRIKRKKNKNIHSGKPNSRKPSNSGGTKSFVLKNFLPISIGILAVFLSFSFITYSPLDNCINVVGGNLKVTNFCGHYGAIVADLMLQFFGLGSWVMVVVLCIWFLEMLFKAEDFKNFNMFFRITIMIFTMCFFSISVGFLESYNFAMQMMPGGYVGYRAAKWLRGELGSVVGLSLPLLLFFVTFFISIRSGSGLWTAMFAMLDNGWTKFKGTILFRFLKYIFTLQFISDLSNNKDSISIFMKELFSFQSSSKSSQAEKVDIKAKSKTIEPLKKVQENTNYKSNKEYTKDSEINTNKKKDGNTSFFGRQSYGNYTVPSVNFLAKDSNLKKSDISEEILQAKREKLTTVLNDFGVRGEINSCSVGPVVTLHELKLETGTKASRVIGLANDIARTMQVAVARIVDFPTKGVMGVELPNEERDSVFLRSIIESPEYKSSKAGIPIILGRDIMGNPVIEDLTRMPHLLVAGTTGSGKSVGINTMILSILYSMSPEDCRIIMIDPKMLELSLYDGIPHLLAPVITEPDSAIVALKWVVSEMTNRYKKMSKLGVRNINGYNQKASFARERGSKITREIEVGYNSETGEIITERIEEDPTNMPYMVVMIDEMADLMVVAGKEIESLVQRIAQMARAAGIHLIMATQRPSVDVITGVIKANFPTRISYQVTSKIDTRTILGEQGAEQLLGQGDMLYLGLGKRPKRVHGPFVSEGEIERVVEFLKENNKADYIDIMQEAKDMGIDADSTSSGDGQNSEDKLYRSAISIVMRERKTSISYVQRQLRIGYNKAANFIERMEREGILTAPDRSGKRSIIAGPKVGSSHKDSDDDSYYN